MMVEHRERSAAHDPTRYTETAGEPELLLQYLNENGLRLDDSGTTESGRALAGELQLAGSGDLSMSDASWLREPQDKLIFDSEDESRHHRELDPTSSSGKLLSVYEDLTGRMPGGDPAGTVAGELVRYLAGPVYTGLRETGIEPGLHDPAAGGPAHQYMTSATPTAERVSRNLSEWSAPTITALVRRDLDDYLGAIQSLQDNARDAQALIAGRPGFEDHMKALTGNADWTGPNLAAHQDELWTALEQSRRDWSSALLTQIAEDAAVDANQGTRTTASEIYESSEESHNLGLYFHTRLEMAEALIWQGFANQERPTYNLGFQNSTKAADEIGQYLDAGTLPDERDDGSRLQEEAITWLRRARTSPVGG